MAALYREPGTSAPRISSAAAGGVPRSAIRYSSYTIACDCRGDPADR
jgi:hypothetical protein